MPNPLRRKVFVLGAGFSKCVLDLPVLRELSQTILEDAKALSEPIEHFLRRDVPSLIKSNVENLLTYLYSDLPWSDAIDSNLRRATFHSCSQLVAAEIKRYSSPATAFPANLIELISYWQEFNCPVLTFNYDTIIEECASKDIHIRGYVQPLQADGKQFKYHLHFIKFAPSPKHPIHYDEIGEILHCYLPFGHEKDFSTKQYGPWKKEAQKYAQEHLNKEFVNLISAINPFSYKQKVLPRNIYRLPLGGTRDLGTIFPRDEDQGFPYFKLHGSVNWYYTGLGERSDDPIYLESNLISKEGLNPVIIPPVLDKNSFYKNANLKIQWLRVAELMRDASYDEFYFVGYSLPPTDMVVKFLFQKNIPSSGRTIYIVNLFDDPLNKRVVLRNYLATFSNWSEQKIEERIERLGEQDQIDLDGVTLDWSLTPTSKTNPPLHLLIKHLKSYPEDIYSNEQQV